MSLLLKFLMLQVDLISLLSLMSLPIAVVIVVVVVYYYNRKQKTLEQQQKQSMDTQIPIPVPPPRVVPEVPEETTPQPKVQQPTLSVDEIFRQTITVPDKPAVIQHEVLKDTPWSEAQATDFVNKVIVVGDWAVGKTKLVERFTTGKFTEEYIMTIGVSFATGYTKIRNKVVKMVIWDTAGQERFDTIRPIYYQGASGVVICYDTTRYPTFTNLPRWVNEIRRNCGNLPIVMVGTKIDLEHLRKVPFTDAAQFAHNYNFPYYETSSRMGVNIEEPFRSIGDIILSAD